REQTHRFEASERAIERSVRGQQAVVTLLGEMLRDLIAVEFTRAFAVEARRADADGRFERHELTGFSPHGRNNKQIYAYKSNRPGTACQRLQGRERCQGFESAQVREVLPSALRRFNHSNTTGSSETMTIPIVTSEKFCFTIGTWPNRKPAPTHKPTQAAAPIRLKNANAGGRIAAAPATNGTNVRTIGTNRPRMIALPPYSSKNACARCKCSRFSSRCEMPEASVALNTRGPTVRPTA